MNPAGKATRIDLFSLRTPPMRAFHTTWSAFFLCFFAWFGIAPLMSVVREQLQLTQTQIGNTIIASVAGTILARLFIGWACDKYGPRRVYTTLLAVGSLPVLALSMAWSYESLLVLRLCIGAIGASFVITQYHTSLMFAPNVVGTANATTAGWGNLGGGVVQIVMPLLFAGALALGLPEGQAWRAAVAVPGVLLLVMAVVYYRTTQDTPLGNFPELERDGRIAQFVRAKGSFADAAKDGRVWALAVIYGACFGIELTINNVASLYFRDTFHVTTTVAGLLAGLHGVLNIFARSLGGILGDRVGTRFGLRSRALLLGGILLVEGVALTAFSRATHLGLAIVLLIVFSIFVEMGCGATYSVVPFIRPKAVGSVSGIVGAGGNLGAVLAGFLFRSESFSMQSALLTLGVFVTAASSLAFLSVRFSAEDERRARTEALGAVVRPQAVPAE